MNIFKVFALVAILGVVTCLPGIVGADTTWSTGQMWYEGPSYAGNPEFFDKIEIFMQNNTILTAPVLIDFPQKDWQSVLVNPKYNLITGPETNYLGLFSIQLPTPQDIARTFDYLVYDKGTLLYGQTITLGGGHMEYPLMSVADGFMGSNNIPYDRTAVPLPGTLLLLFTGLACLAILRGRKRIGLNNYSIP